MPQIQHLASAQQMEEFRQRIRDLPQDVTTIDQAVEGVVNATLPLLAEVATEAREQGRAERAELEDARSKWRDLTPEGRAAQAEQYRRADAVEEARKAVRKSPSFGTSDTDAGDLLRVASWIYTGNDDDWFAGLQQQNADDVSRETSDVIE